MHLARFSIGGAVIETCSCWSDRLLQPVGTMTTLSVFILGKHCKPVWTSLCSEIHRFKMTNETKQTCNYLTLTLAKVKFRFVTATVKGNRYLKDTRLQVYRKCPKLTWHLSVRLQLLSHCSLRDSNVLICDLTVWNLLFRFTAVIQTDHRWQQRTSSAFAYEVTDFLCGL